MKSIGIDIGKRRCIICIMDQNGIVLEEDGYENTYAAADAFARKAKREYGKCQAVCESTGNLWIKTYEAFEDRGIPIELANLMKVRAIAEASVMTDKVDARTLAHLLRTSLIARCHVASREVRGIRQLLRERTNQVRGGPRPSTGCTTGLVGRHVSHGAPVGRHAVPRKDEEGFKQEGKLDTDASRKRGHTA